MAPIRMIDVLNHAKRYHQELRDFFEAEARADHSEEVKTLLRYIGRHEDIMERAIDECRRATEPTVLEDGIPAAVDFSEFLLPNKLDFRPDVTTEEVIAQTLRFEDCLTRCYTELRKNAASEPLRNAIDRLLSLEKQEETRIMRAALEV